MVFINEWLPNPIGNDAKGEFVELFNNGKLPASLSRWILGTSGKKTFSLSGYSIAPDGYLVLWRSETGLTLKNTDESVFLYDQSGRLVDQSSFLGQATEGKSFNRINYRNDHGIQLQNFAWSDPTPGAANGAVVNTLIISNPYPFEVPLNDVSLGAPQLFGLLFSAAVILTVLMLYCLKSHENLSKLFFGGDEALWQ